MSNTENALMSVCTEVIIEFAEGLREPEFIFYASDLLKQDKQGHEASRSRALLANSYEMFRARQRDETLNTRR